jgi:hypothetical protein
MGRRASAHRPLIATSMMNFSQRSRRMWLDGTASIPAPWQTPRIRSTRDVICPSSSPKMMRRCVPVWRTTPGATIEPGHHRDAAQHLRGTEDRQKALAGIDAVLQRDDGCFPADQRADLLTCGHGLFRSDASLWQLAYSSAARRIIATALPLLPGLRVWNSPDSPLEGTGFEPSVPRKRDKFLWAARHRSYAIRLPQQKPALRDRDRWFESISLQRRVSCGSDFVAETGTVVKRAISAVVSASCAIAAMRLGAKEASGRVSEVIGTPAVDQIRSG